MGEIVVREMARSEGLTNVEVSSAGTSGEESGNPIDARAARVLAEAGYPVDKNHRAHRVTPSELAQADLVLAMTYGHANILASRMDQANLNLEKLHLWREFDEAFPALKIAPHGIFGPGSPLENSQPEVGGHYSNQYSSDGKFDVPDPWYGPVDGFYRTLGVIESGAAGLLRFVQS